MATEGNYNTQSRNEGIGRGGQQRVQGGRYRRDLQNNKTGKRGATSSMSYVQKCMQPGKHAAETVALHVVTELQHHSNY